MASVSPMLKRPQEVAAPETVNQVEIDTLMRRFFEQGRSDLVEKPKPVDLEPSARPRRDFGMATELLSRASQAFAVLINRCQRLERDLSEVNERTRVQLAEQDDTMEQWKRLGSGLKAQLEASEQAVVALRAKCDDAEVRATRAERRISALEQASSQAADQAALAEDLLIKLHDSVVEAFGVGSRAHLVLGAVGTQVLAE